MDVNAVILAAGEGTRLKLDCPKALAPTVGRRLIDFPLDQIKIFLKNEGVSGSTAVVVGHRKDEVVKYVQSRHENIQFATQEVRNGTAGALKAFFDANPDAYKNEYTLIMCADTPLIRSKDVERLYSHLKNDSSVMGVAATFIAANPKGYGRILRGETGFSIVEEKDATDEQRKVSEVNSGLYFIKTSYIEQRLNSIDSNNQSGEFYLTDLFSQDAHVVADLFPKESTFLGINDLAQLSRASRYLFRERALMALEDGIQIIDDAHVYIEWDAKIGEASLLYPQVFIHGDCEIGKNCVLENSSILKNTRLFDGVTVKAFSHLEDAEVGTKAAVGPFCRLRPGTKVGEGSKIGNFVEMKKSTTGKGVKVSHLSYVGDAEVGDETNIGCGFITCNYDGANKHKTEIGKGTFIGSDCQAVAPITIGDHAFVAAGSTINQPVPDGGFAISRGRQVVKEGLAKKFLKTKKDKK